MPVTTLVLLALGTVPGCLLPEAPADGVVVCDPAADEPCPTGFFCRIGDTSGVPKCFRTSGGGYCGDGVIDPGEECDTEYRGTETCESRGYWGGHLTCGSDCRVQELDCASFVAVSSGRLTTSALDAEGRIWSWGSSELGQYGNGTLARGAVPERLEHPARFVKVSVGMGHSCALDDQGSIYCWGDNTSGQVGNGEVSGGSETGILRPVQVAVGGTFLDITAGGFHSCALDAGGAVWCWGDSSYHQIRTEPGVLPDPTRVVSTNAFVAIDAGMGHTCALDASGNAFCWGFNGGGQLGTDDTVPGATPRLVTGGHTFSTISAGSGFTCGLTVGGEIWCWGWNDLGQLGKGGLLDPLDQEPHPVRVEAEGPFTVVDTGESAACALDPGGSVVCWGYGPVGATGPDASTSPQVVARTLGLTSVSVGDLAAAGVDASGAPFGWGFSFDGRAGQWFPGLFPEALMGRPLYTHMGLGAHHSCGVDADGHVSCWGFNHLSQSANSFLVFSPQQLRVELPSPARSVQATASTSCAVTTGDQAYCWGDNSAGQAGADLTDALVASPVAVSGNHAFAGLAGQAFGFHFCGVDTAGAVWCWGYNGSAQLGTTAVDHSSVPRRVTLSNPAAAVAVGYMHSCALLENRSVWCWGSNGNGQLGVGAEVDFSATPVQVPGDREYVQVVAGLAATCALDEDGLAWCWGISTSLGSGTELDRATPVQVLGGLRFRKLAAAGSTTCGIDISDQLWCWGDLSSGQSGTGELLTSYVPVRVAIDAVDDVFLGSYHLCASTALGLTQCWGWGVYGQLGTDTYLEAPTEVTRP